MKVKVLIPFSVPTENGIYSPHKGEVIEFNDDEAAAKYITEGIFEEYTDYNPNYTQTITGTAAAPFGDVDFDTLALALKDGNASATMVCDASALGEGNITGFLHSTGNSITMDGANITSVASEAYMAQWIYATTLSNFYTEKDGVIADVKEYASAIPTTLTIYWHPMPGGEE